LPIHKNNDKSEFGNYRPISLLSVISKIFEKYIYKKLEIFVKDNKIIPNYQYGFMKNNSCENALQKLDNRIREMRNKKQKAIVIFLDFKKAFDSVSHEKLIGKIKKNME
jgi:hypothetical protein